MKPSRSLSLAFFFLPVLLPLQGGGPPQGPASRPAPGPKGRKPKARLPLFPGLPLRRGKAGPDKLSPLVGTWEIRKAFFPGAPPSLRVHGYAVFTRAYASFQIFLQEGRAQPLFQSGFWRYSYLGGRLRFQALLGLRTAPGGRLVPERKGGIHQRIPQFLAGGVLRLYKAGGAYLEMVRLE